MAKIIRNKISTLGYFNKRLKDSGYVVWKVFNKYQIEDTRKWTILVNPGRESLYITCMVNVSESGGSPHFDIYDGGNRTGQKTATIVTDSMEVIINHLIKWSITPDSSEYKSIPAEISEK
jgi:hypothetical protein